MVNTTREKNKEEPQEFVIDDLFQYTMKKNWEEVVKICNNNPSACKAKLTKSEETALHIAVSSYHADQIDANKHADVIRQLVRRIPSDKAVEILLLKNDKGDTPLHLAASLGSVSICQSIIALKDTELINSRNLKGETPLFLAAHHGKMEAFLCLHNESADKKVDDSLWRRKDGDTILHSAVSGEYFELAYQIIIYYPRSVNSVNQEGFSPLHILARKPNVFQSSSNLRICDRLISRWVIGHELKKQKFDPKSSINNYPENYQTCMKFIYLPRAAFRIIAFRGKGYSTEKQISITTDEENPKRKAEESQGKESKQEDTFPPNYGTCIQIFKFAMNFMLVVLGIGIWRISKIRKKKEKHEWAVQIMEELIQKESIYKYDNNGRMPIQQNIESMYAERIKPPSLPPQEPDTHSSVDKDEKGSKSKSNEDKDEDKTVAKTKDVKKGTPILLAAKMGITEMVAKILETFPVAIQDLDASGKNALLLAVENRQTKVYDLLMKMELPEFVLYQVDESGNSAVHLAAMFQRLQPWRIPGTALQMQWEIKWYKYVKHSMPPHCFIHYNKQGETASEIFRKTHEDLVKDGSKWLIKTSESCSVVAALIATVAFATSTTVPGGVNQETGHPTTGHPLLEEEPAFEIFSIASIVALSFSVTALVFFLAILTSRCQPKDFRYDLPRKLLIGLSSLFTSIAAILFSFCSGHFFILKDKMHTAAFPIYAVVCLPITFFAFAQLPLYFDLLWSIIKKVPLRSYKVFYT
ncbi:hypothetical protein ACH5RR_031776 [Cinchona calisaya]|uniref:PGG domain-containing protein n=1 Tax=Cinchona calisaya TaxID=153742 RepID=A0ABD2YK84_9GENT